MLTMERLNAEYEIVDTTLWDRPRDLSKAPPGTPLEGDCQTYVATAKGVLGVSFPGAIVIRCWSPLNRRRFPFVPRHAVLWVKGKGFIESTEREWRKLPFPNWPAWPVGTPLVLAVLQAGEALGLWPGLVRLALAVGIL